MSFERMRWSLLCLFALTTTTFAQVVPTDSVPADPVPAEQSSDDEARARFLRGVELARAGNCEGALAELRVSLSLVERPNTLFNMARCYEQLFRYDLAVTTYQRYLEIAPADADDRPSVETSARMLTQLLGTISVTSNVPAEVWLGDRMIGESPGEVLIPGGRHALELRAPEHVPLRREVEVAAQQRVALNFELERAEVTVNNVENVTNVTNVENRSVQVTEEGGAPPGVFYAGVGLTAASALVAGVLGAMALSEASSTEALSPYDLAGRSAGNESTASKAVLADVMWGVTGVLGVTTLVLFFLTDFDDSAQESAGLHLRPSGVEWVF